MDLKDNQDLKNILKTFTVLEQNSVLSSGGETESEVEISTDEEWESILSAQNGTARSIDTNFQFRNLEYTLVDSSVVFGSDEDTGSESYGEEETDNDKQISDAQNDGEKNSMHETIIVETSEAPVESPLVSESAAVEERATVDDNGEPEGLPFSETAAQEQEVGLDSETENVDFTESEEESEGADTDVASLAESVASLELLGANETYLDAQETAESDKEDDTLSLSVATVGAPVEDPQREIVESRVEVPLQKEDETLQKEEESLNEAAPIQEKPTIEEAAEEPAVAAKSESFYADWCADYMAFTDANPTTYHAVRHFAKVLDEAGFVYLSEKAPFKVSADGGLYYTIRGEQSLVAFAVGKKWTPTRGVGAVGSHVDALTAKLKPFSTKHDVKGYQMLGVAPYSGALNHLWLDRDLGIAGLVLVRDVRSRKVLSRLVSSGRHPICRIPSLAPHFGAAASRLPYNKETKMVPVIGYGTLTPEATQHEKKAPLYGKHSLALLRYVADLAGTSVEDIVLADLELYDVQAATRGGLSSEFIYAPRIDDRLCLYAAVHALVDLVQNLDLTEYDGFSAVLLANNEEIGSATRTGAKGKLLNSVVERVVSSRGYSSLEVPVVFANLVILSADVTHALNPNFLSAYLDGHYPVPNTGLTLKLDANGHVMTDLTGVALMHRIAAQRKLTLQQFHIRNDKPSGGTIGPMLAVDTGARVVDVGLPQLSMHSIRASAGYKEAGIGVETFAAFFQDWRAALDEIDYS